MNDTLHPVNAVGGTPAYSGRMLRQVGAIPFAMGNANRMFGVRSGVRPGTWPGTVSATSTTWTCNPFSGVIDAQAAIEAGAYSFAFDGQATGSVAAASASFARTDIIYVQVDDPAESDGSTVPAVTRKYLAGVAGAGAPIPATPARSMVVARINVPVSGGGAPSVTWVAPVLTLAGAEVQFASTAERDAYNASYEGLPAYNLENGLAQRFRGGAWVTGNRAPHCRVVQSAGQTTAASTFGFAILQWDTEESDPLDMHKVASPSAIYAPVAGVYSVSAGFTGGTSSMGYGVRLLKNGGVVEGTEVWAPGLGANGLATPTVSTTISCAAGDTLQVAGAAAAASQGIAASVTHRPFFAVTFLGSL